MRMSVNGLNARVDSIQLITATKGSLSKKYVFRFYNFEIFADQNGMRRGGGVLQGRAGDIDKDYTDNI